MTQDFKKFLNFFGYFRFSGYFVYLISYPKIDNSYWLHENNQWIKDKFFREKLMVSNGFDLFFSRFFTEFLFLPELFVVFISIKLVVMSY